MNAEDVFRRIDEAELDNPARWAALHLKYSNAAMRERTPPAPIHNRRRYSIGTACNLYGQGRQSAALLYDQRSIQVAFMRDANGRVSGVKA